MPVYCHESEQPCGKQRFNILWQRNLKNGYRLILYVWVFFGFCGGFFGFWLGFFCWGWGGVFNSWRVGFGWTDINADSAVCLWSLLKRFVSHLKISPDLQWPALELLHGGVVCAADSMHREADDLIWLMSNLWRRPTSVWLVAWKPSPWLFPCARCECSQLSIEWTKTPSHLQSEDLGRKADSWQPHTFALFWRFCHGACVLMYTYLKKKPCSAPNPSLAVLGTLLSEGCFL